MTHMLRKHQSDHHHKKISTNNPIHKDSRVISKIQPKIRIIHIFAPEIIQTDVANFRELVQRLTGKPSPSSATTTTTTTTAVTTTTSTSSGSSSLEKNTNANNNKVRKLPVRPQFAEEAIHYNQISKMEGDGDDHGYNYQNYKPIMNVGNKGYFGNYDDGDHNGGFLEVFDGVNDCFMQQINDFSNVTMEANHHHHPFGDNFHQLSYRGSY